MARDREKCDKQIQKAYKKYIRQEKHLISEHKRLGEVARRKDLKTHNYQAGEREFQRYSNQMVKAWETFEERKKRIESTC